VKILNFLFFPEKSGLSLALWAARFFVLLAWVQFFRTLELLVTVGIEFFKSEAVVNLLLGSQVFKGAQEAFGISILLLIGSHLLVVLVIQSKNKVLSSGNA